MKTEFDLRNFTKLIKNILAPLLLVAMMSSCEVAPEPILYGSDVCHFCRMTIVDQQHGAEMVTRKGKVFKFDAVECLLNHTKETDTQSVALYLVNTYTEPGKLQDAYGATYLVSEGIPSPMGEFLTAFENETDAQKSQNTHGGKVYSWEEIRNRFNK